MARVGSMRQWLWMASTIALPSSTELGQQASLAGSIIRALCPWPCVFTGCGGRGCSLEEFCDELATMPLICDPGSRRALR